MFWINNLHGVISNNVSCSDHTCLMAIDPNRFWLIRRVFHNERFDIQNNVSDVLNNTGDSVAVFSPQLRLLDLYAY